MRDSPEIDFVLGLDDEAPDFAVTIDHQDVAVWIAATSEGVSICLQTSIGNRADCAMTQPLTPEMAFVLSRQLAVAATDATFLRGIR